MKQNIMLDFYRDNQISPVRQEIHDLDHHFQRREALYRHLGIISGYIKGKTVLEVGPGSGYNSLYIASLKPDCLVLVEPNPQGTNDIRELLNRYQLLNEKIFVVMNTIEEYQEMNKEQYDYVFCEGLLGAIGVSDPKIILNALVKAVSSGGILVITCMDELAYLSELLRRLLANLFIKDLDTINEKVQKLLPVFSPHLSQLPGMTRRYDDWIIDTLINPASCSDLFTISDALTAFPEQIEFFSSSPHFVTDWRWYKDIYGPNRNFNQIALQQYWENIHNLLDYRFTFPPRDVTLNKQLYQICKSIRHNIQQYENNPKNDILQTIRDELKNCIHNVNDFSPETALSLQEALDLLSVEKIEANDVAEMRKFAGFFGRGQQYLSFTKRNVDNNATNFRQNGIIS